MRPLFAYLNAAVVATAVYAATEDWGRSDVAAEDSLVERIDRAALELSVAMSVRGPAAPKDPFADPVPFDQLLQSS
jgi:FMN reductase